MECVKPDDFDSKVLGDNKKTMVLFFASWCPYCISIKPYFEEINAGNIRKVEAQVDEDDNLLWDKFNIQAIPTIIVFENGRMIARKDAKKHVGLTKNDIDSIIKELA